ncbi:unnamed protein product, partial [Linum tenue]
VQFPELPVHFYHREILFAIGNLIGRTVKLDYHTETLQRGKFARIAIDLDMTKPGPMLIYLDGIQQQVVYENLPQICYGCDRIGHLEEGCPERNPPQVLALAVVAEGTSMNPPVSQSPELPTGYGSWMQVTRKSRKQTKNKLGNSPNLPLTIGADSGKNEAKSSGKGKVDNPKGVNVVEKKGKKDFKEEQKKGLQGIQKGKAVVLEAEDANGKKKSNGSVEWRVKDYKEKRLKQAHLWSRRPKTRRWAKPLRLQVRPYRRK